jgi:hypothetical protein
MIDNEVLEDLLREAAEGIAVPADGPARVLAARADLGLEPARPGRTRASGIRVRMPRPRVALAGLTALAAVGLLVGVGADLAGSGSSGSPTVAQHALATPALKAASAGSTGSSTSGLGSSGGGSAGGTSAGPGSAGFASNSPSSSAPTAPAAGSPAVPSVVSKVIQTGSVSLQVSSGQVNAAMTQLTSDATALGGFVASTNTQTGTGPATGAITLRVPVAAFDQLLNEVRRIGKVTSVTTSGQDVTSQYADLSAQLQSLEDTRTQFQQIMTQATTIGDILSVEQQISDLQTQIQELQSQLQVMENQTTYGTLSVQVTEQTKPQAVAPTPPSGLAKAWGHSRHTFARGLEAVVGALGGIAVFLTCVLGLV